MLSVLIYVSIQMFPIVWLLTTRRSSERWRIRHYLVAFAPICLFAAVRGAVGTDTGNYREYYEALETAGSLISDPLFVIFQLPFKALGLGSQAFLAGQAVFCWLLFSVGAARVDKMVPLVGVGLLPVLMLDATFNGLRYGMAFAAAIWLVGQLEGREVVKSGLAAVLPGLFHSSMLLLILARLRSRAAAVLAVIAGLALVWANLTFISTTYLFQHVSSYDVIQRPEWYSGAFPVVQVAMVWFIARRCGVRLKVGSNVFTVGLAAVALGLGLLGVSYASLRFLQVGVFLLAIAVSRAATEKRRIEAVPSGSTVGGEWPGRADGKEGEVRPKAAEVGSTGGRWAISPRMAVCALGVVSVMNFWRQIFVVGAAGSVFFVPYTFCF